MARTNATRVEAILGGNYNGSTDLTTHITTATIVVDRLAALDTGGILSAAALAEIEAFLSAHYYAHHDQLYQSKTTGRSGATFQGQTGMGFKSTQYGQSALELDFTGNLASLGKKAPSMSWLGLPPSSQTDYEDRD